MNQKILSHIEPYEHVIWDWNGTLVNDVAVAVEAINVLLMEHKLPTLSHEKYRTLFGFPVKNYYEKLGFDFSKVSFEKICDRFMQEYNHNRAQLATLFHGVPELLEEIKKTKKQSILSAAAQWHLNEITEHFQIQQHFHHRFGIDNHYAASKLERGRELIHQSEIPNAKTILIGDTDHDCEVARDLKIDCLLIADGHQTFDRLNQIHHNVIFGRKPY